ncbi:MAG: AAA family ATPase [Candidatus Tectomicrobia bacterium]|nr:AAA family ATPase [Candidatus Tectomicrobia bacterium]
MIKRVQIEGFKSFKKLDFEMKPLNVLIGPNGGGKTNFIDALKFIREAAYEDLVEPYLRRGGSAGVVFRGLKEQNQRIKIALRFDWGPREGEAAPIRLLDQSSIEWERGPQGAAAYSRGVYRFALRPRPTDVLVDSETFSYLNDAGDEIGMNRQPLSPDYPPRRRLGITQPPPGLHGFLEANVFDARTFGWVGEMARGWKVYQAIDTGPDSEIREPVLARHGFVLKENGSNLTSVLHNLQSLPEGEEAFRRIEEGLRLVFRELKKMAFPAQGGDGRLFLSWREGPFEKNDFSAMFLSDGTLKFLALLAIFLCPTPPPLVLVEEPELGLHPDMIHYVAALAQEASHRTQIIMTTHSPTLVSALKPEEVVVVEKEDGETKMRRLSDRAGLEGWLKDFSLGELWEMGEIGGRPK